MAHYQTHKELHKALLETAATARRMVEDAHAADHAAAALAALVPAPGPGVGVAPPSPPLEPKR